jgi:hypothetical protein
LSEEIKRSGFTIIKNAVKYDFPFFEAVESVLPLVDEFVISVGQSEDTTAEEINKWLKNLSDPDREKIVLFNTTWDDSIKDGRVLSIETNKALEKCRATEWLIYIQADECLHENDRELIEYAMNKYNSDSQVEALALSYLHFYGNYSTLNTDRGAYRFEVRILKPLPGLKSFGDAQGFRFESTRDTKGRKPNAVKIPAQVFHYGYVRPIDVMKTKAKDFDLLFHKDNSEELSERKDHWEGFKYQYKPGLMPYLGSHPKIMEDRINKNNWKMDLESMKRSATLNEKIKDLKTKIENVLPFRIGEFKNYKVVKKF